MAVVFTSEEILKGYIEEDAGEILIAHFEPDDLGPDPEVGLYVELNSSDPRKGHLEFRELLNKRVRITVEIVG